ncbi:MAG: hypothetical protein JXR41_13915 [Bacteroidales bacterium]|nr:hypothetical protein [Bacteroidales bacterium]MBN2764184.1 hypothetical protein [Bacteroidales bacterium]
MKVSDDAKRLRQIIEKAIEDHKLTQEEYEIIIHQAIDDGHIDPQEKVLLKELNEMMANKTIKIIPNTDS